MKKVLQFRIEEESLESFKQYCISKDTTMSNILIDYIYTLLPKESGKSPASKKNSVKKIVLIKLYHCPHCGKDITHLDTPSRLTHLQNCESRHNS